MTLPSLFSIFSLSLASLSASPWSLQWSDEFSGNVIDEKIWSKCQRAKSDWKNTMSDDARLYEVSDGTLKLKGIVNDNKDDSAPFLTAGLQSKGKYNFQYGKIQIRARFKSAQGAWPALWMLGEKGRWPANGEIDLMEHLNFDNHVFQTIHSSYSKNPAIKSPPKHYGVTKIDRDGWNTYGCEWDEDKIIFTVNGKNTFTYPRLPKEDASQYPFTQPFYIILSMQIGGSWVNGSGPTNPAHYPSHLEVDWVRVYKPS